MNKPTLSHLVVSGLLVLAIGLFSGYTMGYFQAQKASFPKFEPVEDLNPGVATIKLLKYEEGKIFGEIAGREVRLAYSPEDIKSLAVGEAFEIPIQEISLGAYYSAQSLPEGVNFIASQTGKYYYHVLDPRALRITPKNRQYFFSEDEALEAGYIPPK